MKMLDDMFTFINPIIELTEDSLSEFIVQMDAFLDERKNSDKSPRIQRPISEETYKEMWMLRYQQHLGNISFMELLDQYEKMLGISSTE